MVAALAQQAVALSAADQEAFHALWLFGLHTDPAAFLLTHDEVAAIKPAQIAADLTAGHIWGVHDAEGLAGFGVLHPGSLCRLQHKADIGPLFVHPRARGKGSARHLMQALVSRARQLNLLQAEICVDETNTAAVSLYRRFGFVEFGRRPRSVLVDGRPRNDLLMLLQLDAQA